MTPGWLVDHTTGARIRPATMSEIRFAGLGLNPQGMFLTEDRLCRVEPDTTLPQQPWESEDEYVARYTGPLVEVDGGRGIPLRDGMVQMVNPVWELLLEDDD